MSNYHQYMCLHQYLHLKFNDNSNCDFFLIIYRVRAMVFNATFNNISIISWRSVLLVEETVVPVENHRPAASHWQNLSHNVYRVV